MYNYFPAKEDLFLDRSKGVVEVETVSPRVGLMDGYAQFMTVIQESPALRSRMWAIGQEVLADLEQTLREETGGAEDGMTAALIAGQINWLHGTALAAIGQRMVAGGKPSEVSRDVLLLLGEMEELLNEKVLNYAVRGAG
ncbi:TetR/AcrR family transcriptional regulator [Streptomyces marokkonensis]|uniref:TetR/AcrR family transcriptional regulator n=1 Tax=Streptomyces marokkonensis TaxID=324855 RepID=A0ABP7Q3Q5_9ACTN